MNLIKKDHYFILFVFALTVISIGQNKTVEAKPSTKYGFAILADFSSVSGQANEDECIPIRVSIMQSHGELKQLRWAQSPKFRDFSSLNGLEKSKDGWQWRVPKDGGLLSYCAVLTSKRGERYDSRVTKNWALFRADDLFPAAVSKAMEGRESLTSLKFSLPQHWSSVTRYPSNADHIFSVQNPERKFDRPTGWVLLGEFGLRRDIINGTNVAIAAPLNHNVTRLEMMTLLTFTLPEIKSWFIDFPDRLLVVSATEQMWRGALSGPGSLYIHGERPLISENGTSTFIHELVHVGMQRQAADGADWIDEGLAEYLSILLLHRAGGMSENRFNIALNTQKKWSKEAKRLGKKHSRGAQTAKAVVLFANIHNEMGDKNFKALVKQLAKPGQPITPQYLEEIAEKIHRKTLKMFALTSLYTNFSSIYCIKCCT